jgi:acid phosphatase
VVVSLASACGTGGRQASPATGPSPTSIAAAPPSADPPSPAPPSASGTAVRPDHVVIAIFENKAFQDVAGNARAAYVHGLLQRAAVFTASSAITHPSQPNYIGLFSGSTQGVTNDHCPVRLGDRPNLGSQLVAAGRTFIGYSEDLPTAGFRGCGSGRYAAKHNPWVDFDNVPAASNQPYSAFPSDFASLPTVSIVVPNLCNDTHDCDVATGDRWIGAHLDGYLRWADTHNSLLIVTFDENDGSPGNRILTLFAGARVKAGTYPEPVTHYRLLRTVESFYGLAPLGQAAATAPITDVWQPS